MKSTSAQEEAFIEKSIAYFKFQQEILMRIKNEQMTEKKNRIDTFLAISTIALTIALLLGTFFSSVVQTSGLTLEAVSKTQEQVNSLVNGPFCNFNQTNSTSLKETVLNSTLNWINLADSYAQANKSIAGTFGLLVIAMGVFIACVIFGLIWYEYLYNKTIKPVDKDLDDVEEAIELLHLLKVELNTSIASETDIERLINTPVDKHGAFLSELKNMLVNMRKGKIAAQQIGGA
ncbi:MAG: hypothetical protein NTX79_01945 [Candidatus Micrarchaeota archaeon]|nr:hypothetical protein [Candidatus Micrarchaeota archaeon]